MTTYSICNQQTGETLARVNASSASEALEEMARNYGFKDMAHMGMCGDTGGFVATAVGLPEAPAACPAPSELEQFYDDEIAPALLAIAEKCRTRGLSIVATVQFGPEMHDRGDTIVLQADASLPMVMLKHCASTAPNIDSYVIGLERYCNEHGIDTSASVIMRINKAAS